MPAVPPNGKRFQKGQSGNPGGRAKGIEGLARAHTPEAIEALVAALKRPGHAVSAAVALLDRGWGKPRQAIEHSGEMFIQGGIDAPSREPERREEWIARRRAELEALDATDRPPDTRH